MRVAKVTRNIHNMITLVLNGIFRRQNLEFCRQIFGGHNQNSPPTMSDKVEIQL